MSKILLVDDDPHVLSALQRTLRLMFQDEQPQIEAFTNPMDALNRICTCDFDLVISDYRMPQLNGAELLEALKEVAPDTVRIMLSASAEFDTMLHTINQAQAFRFMLKPWDPVQLEDNVRQALALRASLLAAKSAGPSAEQLEAARLEAEEPGILHVRRDADGAILL
jgi:two-component system probable response regulator PhcQ